MHRKWWTLAAVSVATFMLLLDITVVNVALPSIREDLGASFTDLQWVVDAYALTLAALVLTAGSLADRLGRRRLFSAGLAIFSVASLAVFQLLRERALHASQMVDPDRRLGGDLHAPPRHHGRERGPAVDP